MARKKEDYSKYVGQRFGRLTAVGVDPGNHRNLICRCDCGNTKVVRVDALRHGNVKSCGCLGKESFEYFLKHNYVDGTSLSRIASRKVQANNKTGCKGVFWNQKLGAYTVSIGLRGKIIYIGRFSDRMDAIAARLKAEEEYYAPILAAHNYGRTQKRGAK